MFQQGAIALPQCHSWVLNRNDAILEMCANGGATSKGALIFLGGKIKQAVSFGGGLPICKPQAVVYLTF